MTLVTSVIGSNENYSSFRLLQLCAFRKPAHGIRFNLNSILMIDHGSNNNYSQINGLTTSDKI